MSFNRGTAERVSEATELAPDQLLMFAENALAEHDPEQQATGYDRCSLCNFTRHPCDTFDLAAYVVRLLKPTSRERAERMVGKASADHLYREPDNQPGRSA